MERDGTDFFTVDLCPRSTADVRVTYSGMNLAEGEFSTTPLTTTAHTFTPPNWRTLRTITMVGVDDFSDDGHRNYRITSSVASSEGDCGALSPGDVGIDNRDNDTVVTALVGTLTTWETDSAWSATFSVEVMGQPLANVEVARAIGDTTEGAFDTPTSGLSSQILTFVDSDASDGDRSYTLDLTTTSPAGDDNLLSVPADILVTNREDPPTGACP